MNKWRAGGTALHTPRFDPNGDGYADPLTQQENGIIAEWTSMGTSPVKYLDVLAPGHETASGTQILTLTTTGHLSLWDYASFPSGSPVWKGTGWNTYNKVAAPGDLDGDGRAEIVGINSTGRLYRYSGTGHTGTATPRCSDRPRARPRASGRALTAFRWPFPPIPGHKPWPMIDTTQRSPSNDQLPDPHADCDRF